MEQRNEALRLRMLSVGKTVSVKSILLQGQKELQALLAFQAFLFNRKNNGPENDPDIYAGLYNVDRQNGSSQYKSFLMVIMAISEALPLFQVRANFLLPGAMGKC